MVLGEMPLDIHDVGHAFTQGRDTIVLAARNHDLSIRPGSDERLGDAQFVLATMPARQHERRIEVFAFGLRRYCKTGSFKRAEIRAKALDEMQGSLEPVR
ncbi:hypothetical protein ACSBOB_30220 [Mesorhizobium sp. ASY16-5R]|uniref:hypothetical protein n=1 Tax=Mesorhizobium sp. ASY16-5R TaxID=3445772 RepID=UPI003F9F8C0A